MKVARSVLRGRRRSNALLLPDVAVSWQRKRDLLAAADAETALQRQVAIQEDGSEDPGSSIDQLLDLHPDHLEMPHQQPGPTAR